MNLDTLNATARAIVANGKGILAADESTGTIEKRFKSVGVENAEENRRAYRDLLFSAHGIENTIGGVIQYDETIRQKAADGTPFPKLMEKRGIIPGIKVDKGVAEIPGAPGEKFTMGLDGLRERLKEYKGLGARFAKWRAVYAITDSLPSCTCVATNAQGLAAYAALCQEQDIVPIVEPEVLMDGGHTIERCYDVTEEVLRAVFAALVVHRVALEGILLKPNMVIAGKECPKQAKPQQVAEMTLRCFRRTVPAAVPGIVFLSGGQSELEATSNLDAMNKLGKAPWPLSFSYGRALQESALKAWKGIQGNVAAAQRTLAHRGRCNTAAALGKWSEAMERELVPA